MAKEAEGLIEQAPCEGPECQKPQAAEDRPAPGYDNDVPLSSWLRNGDACSKPSFDYYPHTKGK